MTSNSPSYKDFADQYYKPRLEQIQFATKLRPKSMAKLAYLFDQHKEISNKLDSMAPNLQTPIKENIKNAHSLDKVHSYMTDGNAHEDMMTLANSWADKYEKYVIEAPKKKAKQYIDVNTPVLPHEVLEAFRAEKSNNIFEVSAECIGGICYGMVLLKDYIEVEITEAIESANLSYEVMEEIREKYGTKISWGGSLNSLGKLINMLYFSSYVLLENNSGSAIANLAFAHFDVKVQGTNKSASSASFKRPILETHDEAKQNSKNLKKLL